MTFGFQNLMLLFGLAALALPVLIHLLNRRRFDVVDWGAMQFLQVSRTTRRRLRLEELLLLLLRMSLVAVLVLALAAPYASGGLFSLFAERSPRDIVIILDASASMARSDGKGLTPFEAAKTWVSRLLDELSAEDRVALIIAREQPRAVIEVPSPDYVEVRRTLTYAAPPVGGCDLPQAVERAHQILTSHGRSSRREIIVLSDGQRWGWADPETLSQWQKMTRLLDGTPDRPHFLAVHLSGGDEGGVRSNFSLAPIRTLRATAWSGQQVTFRSALRLEGFASYQAPWRVRVEVNGRSAGDLALPDEGGLVKGQLGLSFTHRFATAGSYVVSLIVEPDLPAERRPSGYRLKDCLPGDNRQDIALTVHETLPVLLVDGDKDIGPESTTFFVKKALEQSPDPKRPPVMQARVVNHGDFAPELLQAREDRPRVLVLADVPRLTEAQQHAVEQFVHQGGGVLVALGERVDRDAYNKRLLRNGEGFLPARLDEVARKQEGAASPDVRKMHHPALGIFTDEPNVRLSQARLPRWWKVAPAPGATVAAMLDTEDPLLVERQFGEGRVLLWVAPLDRSWGSNLPGILEFPVLMHELIAYLADGTRLEQNVRPGRPLSYRPHPAETVPLPARLVLQPPHGETHGFSVQRWPWIYDAARWAGVYRLSIDGGPPLHYVVQADPREFDLTPCSEEDRQRVARTIPVEYGERLSESAEEPAPQELWWLFLVGVALLLCAEVWMTRRMLSGQHGAEA